jgi:hypothetical protein
MLPPPAAPFPLPPQADMHPRATSESNVSLQRRRRPPSNGHRLLVSIVNPTVKTKAPRNPIGMSGDDPRGAASLSFLRLFLQSQWRSLSTILR